MSTFSGGYGPEEEDGAGWGGLVPSKAELRAEAKQAALEKDAARYRWLRDNPWPPILEADIALHRNARWDASIDAAMDAARKQGEPT